MKEFSVILPAYNEEKNIEGAVSECRKYFSKKFKSFEIIVVDDGSTDKTAGILAALKKSIKQLQVITHRQNRGYGAAVWDGLKAARGKLIFFTDSDLQFDLKDFGKLQRKIKDADAAIGYRVRRSEGFSRSLNAFCWKMLINILLGLKARDPDCAFKLFRRGVIDKIEVKSKGASFSPELLYKIKQENYKVEQVPVSHTKRKFGKASGARAAVILKGLKELYAFYKTQPDLVKSRSRVVYVGAIVALFLSRLIFASYHADFFDASEYIRRTDADKFLNAIGRGHPPFHPVYLFFSYILHNYLWIKSEIVALVTVNNIAGTASIMFAFLLARKFFGSRVAWLATIFYALLPFVFISQTTILVDPSEHLFYFISLYPVALALDNRGRKGLIVSFLAGLAMAVAALVHTQVAFWAPGVLAVVIIWQKKWDAKSLKILLAKTILYIVGALVCLPIYLKLLLVANAPENIGLQGARSALHYLLFSNAGDRGPVHILQLLRYYFLLSSSVVGVLAILGFISGIFRKNIKVVLALLLWFLPGFALSSTYIYENLHGRAMILGLYPVCILAALFLGGLKNRKLAVVLAALVILQLGVLTVPVASKYHRQSGAFEQLAKAQQTSDEDGVFISSNVSRTWSDYKGTFVNFGDVGVGAEVAVVKAKEALGAGKSAYVSSDAIDLPVRRYDGKFFDLRSTGVGGPSGHPSMLGALFGENFLTLDKVFPNYRLAVYKITKQLPENFISKIESLARQKTIVFGRVLDQDDPIANLTVNLYGKIVCRVTGDDISRLDAGFCLVRNIAGTKMLDNWSYTDADGRFYVPTDQEDFDLSFGALPGDTRSKNLVGKFGVPGESKMTIKSGQRFETIAQLEEALAKELGSFYVVAHKDREKQVYDFYSTTYKLEETDTIEAENMSGEIGKKTKDSRASAGEVRSSQGKAGYLISGPYMPLEAGKYSVNFTLTSDTEDPDPQIEFDIWDNLLKRGFRSLRTQVNSFSGSFHEQKLDFTLDTDAPALEFRVRVPAGVEVKVDKLVLEKFN